VKAKDKEIPFVSRFPVIYDGAEHIARGYLQRRNILTFLPPRGYLLVNTRETTALTRLSRRF
jgi:hypothetical protein